MAKVIIRKEMEFTRDVFNDLKSRALKAGYKVQRTAQYFHSIYSVAGYHPSFDMTYENNEYFVIITFYDWYEGQWHDIPRKEFIPENIVA